MNREILFRGKSVDSDAWVYGQLMESNKETLIVSCALPTTIPEMMRIDRHKVYPDSVGQYTGVNDVTGDYLFEGDVIRSIFNDIDYEMGVPEEDFRLVMWRFGSWQTFNKTDPDYDVYGDDLWSYLDHALLVGNVFDNLELLAVTGCPKYPDLIFRGDDDLLK